MGSGVALRRGHWLALSAPSASLAEVPDLDPTPSLGEVLRNQPSVAVVRLVLTAKETAVLDHPPRNRLLDSAPPHEFQKGVLVGHPTAPVLFVGVENLRRGRDPRRGRAEVPPG